MPQYQENAIVTRIEQFPVDNYRLTLYSPQIALSAKPGQFVMVQVGTGADPLLRRPFSIHQTSSDGHIQLYFKVVGKGTALLSKVIKGQEVSVLGPLGKGYRIEGNTRAVLVGGGLGIAPLFFLAKEICRKKNKLSEDVIILGARTAAELQHHVDGFSSLGLQIFPSTDDGSLGHHGFVTEVLAANLSDSKTTVYCCGPEPMMAGVQKICRNAGFACQVSVETTMACGMGACLGCSTLRSDGSYTHVCMHGPVYDAEELQWSC
jgi:dihydroorotate dehydrogenase electron transfer subunit